MKEKQADILKENHGILWQFDRSTLCIHSFSSCELSVRHSCTTPGLLTAISAASVNSSITACRVRSQGELAVTS